MTTVEAVTDGIVEAHRDDEVGRQWGEGRQVQDEGTTMRTDEGVMTDEGEMIDGMIDETIMTGVIDDIDD